MNEIFKCINKTALYLAVEKDNIDIVKLLLMNGNINVNAINKIKNLIFQCHLNLCISITFKLLFLNEIRNYIFG